jgi:hypothetical protein
MALLLLFKRRMQEAALLKTGAIAETLPKEAVAPIQKLDVKSPKIDAY